MTRLISVALLGGVLALAQRQFTWEALSLPLPDVKTIGIDLVGPDCRSIIGVRVDAAAPPAVSITDVIVEPVTSRRPFDRFQSTSKPSEDRISVLDDTVRVVCSAEPGASERIFVSAIQPIRVAVRKNDIPQVSVAVEHGVVIRDGVAEGTTPEGMHQLILEGVSPHLFSVSLTGTSVSLTDVRTHLQAFAIPKSSAPAATTGIIQLTIDATGHVSGAIARALDEAALETIRSWVFQPFVADGQAGPVRALVQFLVMEDGSVATSLDANARVYEGRMRKAF